MKKYSIGGQEILESPGDPSLGTIILLHGYGADAYDLFSLSQLYPGLRWVFPQAPLNLHFPSGFSGKAWFPIDIDLLIEAVNQNQFDKIPLAFPDHIDKSREVVEKLIIDLEIPRSKLILGGFSQGAMLALDVALRGEERCGALLLFSGIFVRDPEAQRRISHHASTPFFQSHGTQDPLLPFSKAQELEQFLLAGGLKGKLHAFQGGHTIPQPILMQTQAFLRALFMD